MIKLRSGQIAKRGAWNTCASKAEAAMLDLTPIEPAAHYERPAVDRMFRKVPPRGACVGDTAFSDAPLAKRLDGYRSPGGRDGS